MPKTFQAAAEQFSSIIELLQPARSMTTVGYYFNKIVKDNLLRSIAYNDQPVDCVLFALDHLKKGDEGLTECMRWLDQAEKAYSNVDFPNEWQRLAEAVRIDLKIQIDATMLANNAELLHPIEEKLSDKQDEVSRSKLKEAANNLKGLMGYQLGSSLDNCRAAISLYDHVLHPNCDQKLVDLIKQRKDYLLAYRYIDAEVFNDLPKHEVGIIDYAKKLCLEGELPKRPRLRRDAAKSLNSAAEGSIFMPPLGLIVIPVAFLGMPVANYLDRSRYDADQAAHDVYYKMLDDAAAWTSEFFKNQCVKKTPVLEDLTTRVKELNTRLRSFLDKYNNNSSVGLGARLHIAETEITYRSPKLDLAQRERVHSDLNSLRIRAKSVMEIINNINEVQLSIASLLDYLSDYKVLLLTYTGKPHSGEYIYSRFLGNTPVNEMGAVLDVKLKEVEGMMKHVESHYPSVYKEVNAFPADLKSRVDKLQQQQAQKEREVDQLVSAVNLTNKF